MDQGVVMGHLAQGLHQELPKTKKRNKVFLNNTKIRNKSYSGLCYSISLAEKKNQFCFTYHNV